MSTYAAKLIWFMVALGLLGLWALQAQQGAAEPSSAASEDAILLLKTAEQTMNADVHVRLVLKKTGPYRAYKTSTDLLGLGREFSRKLGLPELEALTEQKGETVYRQEKLTAEGCTQTLLLTGLGAGQSYAIVKTECLEVPLRGIGAQAAEFQKRMDGQLAELGYDGTWNVIVQGMLQEQSAEGAQEALRTVQGQLQAQAVERYEDSGTVSISYSSGALHQAVDSGPHKVHLQAAIHQDSLTKIWRFTLGTPVITTEY